jgi:hypothetical protein
MEHSFVKRNAFFIFKALFVKIVVFKLRLIGAEVRDPTGVYAEEAHRPHQGKRASEVEINHNSLPGK